MKTTALPTYFGLEIQWSSRALSIVGQLSFAAFGAYSASEFALEGIFEKHWLRRPPRFGIKLLLVKPGNFRTNLPGSGTREVPTSDAYRQRVGRGEPTPPSQTDRWSPKKGAFSRCLPQVPPPKPRTLRAVNRPGLADGQRFGTNTRSRGRSPASSLAITHLKEWRATNFDRESELPS